MQDGEPIERGVYVHDVRHRYSLELRPTGEADAQLRRIARTLEHAGLIEAGATSAPRFQPHMTLFRSSTPGIGRAEAAAKVLARDTAFTLDVADAFGAGRVLFAAPSRRIQLDLARSGAIDAAPSSELDPYAHSRKWTPHVTLAYAVPEPVRDLALAALSEILPVSSAWGSVEVWDLDVRPTELVHRIVLP